MIFTKITFDLVHNSTLMSIIFKTNYSIDYKHRLNFIYLKTLVVASLLAVSSLTYLELNPKLLLAQVAQNQGTAAAKIERRQRQLRQIRPENYSLQRYPVTNSNASHWRNMLWTTALVEPQESYVDHALNGILALTTHTGLSKPQMRTVEMSMQVGTQLYLSNPTFYSSVKQQFLQTINYSKNPQWVAMALSGLARGTKAIKRSHSSALSELVKKFIFTDNFTGCQSIGESYSCAAFKRFIAAKYCS